MQYYKELFACVQDVHCTVAVRSNVRCEPGADSWQAGLMNNAKAQSHLSDLFNSSCSVGRDSQTHDPAKQE